MVYNKFIKCEVCGSITRIRLQVGFLDEHPIAVTCGKCGISLKGKVNIGQYVPSLKFKFENAADVDASPSTLADYLVECSGEFTTRKSCDGWVLQEDFITPFIRYQQKVGSSDKYDSFATSVAILKRTLNIWPQYKRVLQLYKDGNHDYLVKEIKKLFPEEFIMCRNELEIIRAVRMIAVQGFLSPLMPGIMNLPEIGSSILKTDKAKVDFLIDYLNKHDGYSLNQMQEQINDLLGEFVEVFPYLIPAFSLQFCDNNIEFDVEGTTSSTYEDVKQFYLDVYETLANLLIVPAAIDNIKYRNDANDFIANDAGIDTLDKFLGASKANRFHLYNTNEIYMRTINVKYNQKLRNAIGHNDVEYDTVKQSIIYIPNPKKRDKKSSEYLLEFEIEALRMFQAVLMISEYLYRLRELDFLSKGVIPLPVDFPTEERKKGKIYPNEKCPCGSGLKYKKCHGKIKSRVNNKKGSYVNSIAALLNR